MQRDLLKNNLDSLIAESQPASLSEHPEDDEDEEELDQLATLPKSTQQPSKRKSTKDYSPISAATYFEQALELEIGSNLFRIYYTPPPLVPSTSSSTSHSPDPPASISTPSTAPATAPWLANSIANSRAQSDEPKPPVLFVCVHGAGYSGLAFAALAKELTGHDLAGERIGVLTFDARGHGKTKSTVTESQDEVEDMSLATLTEDLVGILREMFPIPTRSDAAAKVDESVKIILVGHSMGGAVVVSACPIIQSLIGVAGGINIKEIVGVAVLDVVEGTALEALHGMNALISSRPTGFESIEKAIEWHVRTKTVSNADSARISVPSLFVDGGEIGSSTRWKWKTDLAKTERFWEGWFTSLSSKFLACRTAKLLILAGADRLDKELMIGQMQGKFQQEVFIDAGHCLQEDVPGKTAVTLLDFYRRNDRVDILKGIKKVGQV